jgi:hypothetical protein
VVTEKQLGWHHCGTCGEVYKAAQDEKCPACVRSPLPPKKKTHVHTVESSSASSRKEFTPKMVAESHAKPQLVRLDPSVSTADAAPITTRQSSERKRKKDHSIIKFVLGWSVCLAVIAGFIKWKFNPETPEVTTPDTTKQNDLKALTLESENNDLFTQAYPSILETANGFFSTNTPDALPQFCRERPRLASIIFNDGPKVSLFKPETSQLIARNVIRPGGVPMIETLPWSIFQGADGDDEGVFRLLVRQRRADEAGNDLNMSIVFYEPGFLHGAQLGLVTPQFLVNRKTRNGRLIIAALEARKNNQPIYGSIFPQADPPNTARVCVKIRRRVVGEEKAFELVDVLACHWMGIDESGVDLTDAP